MRRNKPILTGLTLTFFFALFFLALANAQETCIDINVSKDAYIDGGTNLTFWDYNWGNETEYCVYDVCTPNGMVVNGEDPHIFLGLLYFNLSPIPENIVVTNVSLFTLTSFFIPYDPVVCFVEALQDWNEYTVTYNTKPDWIPVDRFVCFTHEMILDEYEEYMELDVADEVLDKRGLLNFTQEHYESDKVANFFLWITEGTWIFQSRETGNGAYLNVCYEFLEAPPEEPRDITDLLGYKILSNLAPLFIAIVGLSVATRELFVAEELTLGKIITIGIIVVVVIVFVGLAITLL